MKLATLKNGKRDGRLVVVSRDLTRYTDASFLVPTLQGALDDWQRLAPHLETLAHSLDADAVPSGRFHEHDARSPLPRAYQWVTGAGCEAAGAPARPVGAKAPEDFRTGPLLCQGSSDSFVDPRAPILAAGEADGIDMEAQVAVIVSDVAMGSSAGEAREAIRLVVLANGASLHDPMPDAKGLGFPRSMLSPAFSPVAVTPDELGIAWDGGKVDLALSIDLNGRPFGRVNAGIDAAFDFPALIVHAARARPLCAGTVIGSGTIANRAVDGGAGETKTPFLR